MSRPRRVRRLGLALGGLVALGVLAPAKALADTMSTSPAQAYDLGEIESARSTGMGGALNALGVSTTGLYLNPANMALARVYHLEALAAYSPESQRESFGLAIVDSVINSSHVSGGVAATWNVFDPTGMHRVWTDIRAGLAMPFGDHFALGVTGRWLHVDQAVSAGPFGPDLVSDGTSGNGLYDALTLDVGATALLGDFRMGIVGHNLTNPGVSLAPTTLAGGIGYLTQVFALELDGLVDFTTYDHPEGRIMGGTEIFVADHYALRAGWRYDAGTQIHSPSLGFGYIDPRWSIEVGARHDLLGSHAQTLMDVSLRYFYDATGSTTPADEPDAF
ncbi:MAG: hypothetical protein ABSE49_06345 [Polyangiaceae bacterium]